MKNIIPGPRVGNLKPLGDRIDYLAFSMFYSKITGQPVSLSFKDSTLMFIRDRYLYDSVYFQHPSAKEIYEYTVTNYYNFYVNNKQDWFKFDNIPSYNLTLPKKFVTMQWDAGQGFRRINNDRKQKILEFYKDQGYELITVGGEAPDKNLSLNLALVSYIISKADYHIGADSGFQHLAKLILPTDKLHVYINEGVAGPDDQRFDFTRQFDDLSISAQARVLFAKGAKKNYCEEL